MKNFFVVCALFFAVNAVAQKPTVKDTTLNKLDAKGKKHGEWKESHKNGKRRYEGKFDHGIPTGQFKHYYEKTGLLEAQLNYYPGGKKAAAFLYHPNGVVMAQGMYVDKKKDSLWRYYAEDSSLISEEFYRLGVKHGEWKTYYKNGNISTLETYNNGKKEGPFKENFENGKTKREGQYLNEKAEGVFKTYFLTGTIVSSGTYANGLKNGEWLYFNYTTGKQEKKEIYEHGNMVYTSEPRISYYDDSTQTMIRSKEVFNLDLTSNYKHFYESGKVMREGSFLREQKIGEWKHYNSMGNLDSTITYKLGYREGLTKYFANGELKKEVNYRANLLEGRYVEYAGANLISVEGEYKKGKKTGTWKYFNQKGELLKEEKF